MTRLRPAALSRPAAVAPGLVRQAGSLAAPAGRPAPRRTARTAPVQAEARRRLLAEERARLLEEEGVAELFGLTPPPADWLRFGW